MASHVRGTYALAVAVVLLGLCPDLVLSTGSVPLNQVLAPALGASTTQLQVIGGFSSAAFATGVVLAALLAQRCRQRPLFLVYAATFVVGSVLAATASTLPSFLIGRVLQGGSTGLMLIAALPPLMTRCGVRRLSWSAAIVNVGLFGASALGPLVCGAAAASTNGWRILMWVIAGVGTLALLAAAFGYPAMDPRDPHLPLDVPAVMLAAGGTVLVFLATSVLMEVTVSSAAFWLPFILGLAVIAVLVVLERRNERGLMPVRELSTQLPVTGTVVAMVAGAAFVCAIELTQEYLASVAKLDPAAAGRAFWPMPVGLVVASILFGLCFRTRVLPVLVNVGLIALVGGCVVLLSLSSDGRTSPIGWASLLLGFGAGATVGPGLFLAGLGVRATLLGRAFALVQLLRLTATYAVGPVVVYVAMQQPTVYDGVRLGTYIALGLALVGLAAALVIPALSGARPHPPDLDAWLAGDSRGLRSPVTGVHVRPGVEDDDAYDLVPPRLRRRR
jgi:MFS family permease